MDEAPNTFVFTDEEKCRYREFMIKVNILENTIELWGSHEHGESASYAHIRSKPLARS